MARNVCDGKDAGLAQRLTTHVRGSLSLFFLLPTLTDPGPRSSAAECCVLEGLRTSVQQ